ncbi:MAG: hypothetical protein JO131_02070, partial [Gammaproteobacteria bacterium]|nr:hypothetical protein [Gammaproteobacteria bacterium]
MEARLFRYMIGILCLTYFSFQLFYNQYVQWSVDDFWFAHRIYEFASGIPYRDFSPYKTVLGYYILLPTMLLGHDALTPLVYTKNFIALLNTGLFAIAAYRLQRLFSVTAVCTTLTLILSSHFVLSYSTNIRVDLLGYWLCLFSVLFLLENQFLKAGITLGIGFLMSQKVLWYIAASDIALGIYWLTVMRNRTIFFGALLFNLALLIPIGIYIVFWSGFAGLSTILHNMFYEAYIMFQLDSYDSTRKFFWTYTLIHDPFIFLAWPLFFLTFFVKTHKDDLFSKRIFIFTYAIVILFCLIPYKQVFPYYMLTTLPAFILLYSAFFSWLYTLLNDNVLSTHFINKKSIWLFIIVYFIYLIDIKIIFQLPSTCLFLIIIPFLLGLKMTSNHRTTLLVATPAFILITIIMMGIIYPLAFIIKDIWDYPRQYQKSTVQVTEALLKDGSDYLAGIELIYNKNQPIPGLRHLDVPALFYLYHPTPKLATAMLASL